MSKIGIAIGIWITAIFVGFWAGWFGSEMNVVKVRPDYDEGNGCGACTVSMRQGTIYDVRQCTYLHIDVADWDMD